MATKVEPTPTLTGDDADRFIQKLNIPSTEEEIKALKRAKKKLLNKLNLKDNFFNYFWHKSLYMSNVSLFLFLGYCRTSNKFLVLKFIVFS